ncbi:MAG: FAD-dependent oxidoreductase [Candidatus Eremiobacteraeota bacterium]|nr:FAD-dependent oxidoreductase [Candidatus Eremiobacteraeota bacterium]
MITAEDVRTVSLFAEIPEHERETIASHAADVGVHAGEWLIHEGEMPSFFGLLDGRVDVVKSFGAIDRVISTYSAGDFFGEVPLLLGSAAIASVRAVTPVRLMRLDPSDFRSIVLACERFNAVIMRTMAERVNRLQQIAVETPTAVVTICGDRYDPACHDLREFLARNHVAFDWRDPDDHDETATPFVELPDGKRLVGPSHRELADALGMQTAPSDTVPYDVAIIGAGPAGLAAGVYGASEGLTTLLIERDAAGGQAGTSSRIENYLGFPAGLSGDELSMRAWQQAHRFGAEMLVAREVVGLEIGRDGAPHVVLLDGGDRVAARALVIALGVSWRRLQIAGIDRFVGRGVYYGAARTEALTTRGKDVVLVGGGNSAGQAAMFFSNYAHSVTLLIRADKIEKGMSQYLIDELHTKENVHIETSCQVVGFDGNEHLDSIEVECNGSRTRRQTDALFVFIGADARTELLPREIARDNLGYLCTGRDVLDLDGRANWPLARDPYLLETSVPGVFAAGDVRHGSMKRVASGVGEGSMAIAFIHQYLQEGLGVA